MPIRTMPAGFDSDYETRLVLFALVQKLGGRVRLSPQALMAARGAELRVEHLLQGDINMEIGGDGQWRDACAYCHSALDGQSECARCGAPTRR